MGYFEMTLHVDITFRVDSLFKLTIPTLIFTFTNWNFRALIAILAFVVNFAN